MGKTRNAVSTWPLRNDQIVLRVLATGSLKIVAKEFELTPQGFLKDFNRWNDRFANLVSGEWNLRDGLTSKHWEVIRFLRNYYQATNNIPTVYEVCQAYDLDLDDLRELFPGGYRRGACRIAGLPFFA